jgi:hypothetical protein
MNKYKNKNEVKLSETLGNFIQQDRIKAKFHETGINKMWRELMGDMVADSTNSISVKGNKLIIVVNSSPLKHELSFNKEKLIALVNEKLGYEYINEVLIR